MNIAEEVRVLADKHESLHRRTTARHLRDYARLLERRADGKWWMLLLILANLTLTAFMVTK